jgi:LmbE family N-acetylglucosaminyl deacetylase
VPDVESSVLVRASGIPGAGIHSDVSISSMQLHRYLPRQVMRAAVRPLRRGWAEWRRRRQVPMVVSQIARKPGTRVQVFLAHPDDILWCCGLVVALRETGADLALVCLTRGEGGDPGKHPRERLGSVRERELRSCAEVIGIERVHFLGYIDPAPRGGVPRAPQHLSKKLLEEIREQLRRFNPDVLVTHGSSGEGWQPAHLLVHRHVWKALREIARLHQQPPRLVTMNAWDGAHPLPQFLNPDDGAHLVVHGQKFDDVRRAAMACHASQAARLGAMAGGNVDDFAAATVEESYRLW